MAEYNDVKLSLAWSCTIEARNLPSAFGITADFDQVSVGCVLASATVDYAVANPIHGPPRAPGHSGPPIDDWIGVYHHFTVTAHAGPVIGGDTDVAQYYVWTGDVDMPGFPPSGVAGTIVEGNELILAVAISTDGLFLQGAATDAIPIDRGFLWFGDRSFAESWRADGASGTVTCGITSASANIPDANPYDVGANLGAAVVIACSKFSAQDTTYAAVGSPAFATVDVDLSNLELYNPGTDVPDAVNAPSWGRTASGSAYSRVSGASGDMEMFHHGGGSPAASWMGILYVPFIATFSPDDGRFARDEAYAIDYVGAPIEWYYDGGWLTRQVVWSTDLRVVQFHVTWELVHEWQKFSSTTVWVDEDSDWRLANDEDVGSATSQQDDVAVPIVIHPRNVSSLTGDPGSTWGSFVTIGHEGKIPVFKPAAITRPANWTGGDGLTPLAPSGAGNDTWNIAAGSSAPYATIDLPTRKWLRLDRLADHGADTAYHSPDLVIVNRPNLDSWLGDFWDPPADRIAEAEWHWKNHSFGELTFATWPRDATITVTVNYSTITVSDPCYTCFGYRFGVNGEFTYTRARRACTYRVNLSAGSGRCDLRVPRTGDVCPDLYVVDSVKLTFDAPAGDETWILDDLYLDVDTVATSVKQLRMYDPYDWLTDFTMLGAKVDGVRVFDIPYGFESREGIERSLKGRQKRDHCPTTPLSGNLDYAKALSRLAAEVYWQRGWTATDPDPENAAVNKDADGNYVVGTFRWFDLKQCLEQSTGTVPGSPVVRTYAMANGVDHLFVHPKFPQGRARGLMYAADRSGRIRSGGAVYLWRRPAGGGAWALYQGPIASDAQGGFRLGPGPEEESAADVDWVYGISEASDVTPSVSSTFDNRRYWWQVIPPELANSSLDHLRDSEGRLQVYYIDGSGQIVRRVYSADDATWEEAVLWPGQTDDSHPNIMGTPGQLTLIWQRGGGIYQSNSSDNGRSWQVATLLVDAREIPEAEIIGPRNLLCYMVHDGANYARRLGTWNPATGAWQDAGTELAIVAATASRGSLRSNKDGSLDFVFVDEAGAVQHVRGRVDLDNTLQWD